jgi:hypothetical protein
MPKFIIALVPQKNAVNWREPPKIMIITLAPEAHYFPPCFVSPESSGDDVIGDLDGTDPRLIHFIRKWFLEYPDPKSRYFFSKAKPVLDGQINQESML